MRVLVFNCGTSTLRFDVLEPDHGYGWPSSLATGVIQGIGSSHPHASLTIDAKTSETPVPAADHSEAFAAACELLEQRGRLSAIDAVGHRVVHGGPSLTQAATVDDGVIAAIEGALQFAPLHNSVALAVIRHATERFPSLPQIAAFDTAFFVDLPEASRRYALPRDLTDRLGIRRFGFQGLAHHYMVEHYRALHPLREHPRLITLQLGTDCSITASIDGKPIDTSMGATLAEGLIMGSRSGDIDPAIPLLLMSQGGMQREEVWRMLNTRSGLLGLSGRTADFKELIELAAEGDADAILAYEAFCRRAKKYLGAYLALLGGADAIVFGGGIGQHSPEVRARICDGMEWAGVQLDERWNRQARTEMIISPDDAPTEVWVMRVDEAAVIALEMRDVLTAAG